MSYIFYRWLTWRCWRWVIIVVLGTLLLAVQCNTSSEKEVSELKMQLPASTSLEMGQVVTLWVDTVNLESPVYTWHVSLSGQPIKEEQGNRFFSFSPDKPGIYEISLEVVDSGETFRPTPVSIPVSEIPTFTPTHTPVATLTFDTETPTYTPTSSTSTPTPTPTTPSPTPTAPSPVPIDTPTATPTPAPTCTPTVTPTPTPYPSPILTGPDNGSGVQGEFPPLFWEWDGKLGEDEFFEVRIWHESIIDYHPALGWVKVPQFDYNVSGELNGKYYWTVIVVKGTNARPKDWTLQPWWPYPMWEGDLVAELSAESEPRFFLFTPDETSGPGPISGQCQDPLGRPRPCQ